MNTYSIKRIELTKKAIKAFLVGSAILFFAYVFILGDTIFDVVGRKVGGVDGYKYSKIIMLIPFYENIIIN